MKDALMTVSCPNCASAWWLPARFLGSGGARVRCPACAHRFEVAADEWRHAHVAVAPRDDDDALGDGAEPAIVVPPGLKLVVAPDLRIVESPEPARPVAGTPVDDAFSTLAARARDLIDAEARGRLFAEHGGAILEAFDRFAEAHPGADAEAFHRALSERTGITLPPPLEPSSEPTA